MSKDFRAGSVGCGRSKPKSRQFCSVLPCPAPRPHPNMTFPGSVTGTAARRAVDCPSIRPLAAPPQGIALDRLQDDSAIWMRWSDFSPPDPLSARAWQCGNPGRGDSSDVRTRIPKLRFCSTPARPASQALHRLVASGVAAVADYRRRSQYQQLSQVPLPHLGNPTQPLSTAV